jgi:pimeloyl-ACP methyl ester carboxylesterase
VTASGEQPLLFEAAGRPLYGVYHGPRKPRAAAPVVVHVHGLGVEQIALYRVETLAARAAAERGFPAFRWHARGHGDSSGDFADVTLEGMVEDALAAAAEARKRSGAARVVWVGARFGALVAARAAARDRDPAGLVLWEPVHRPADYFRGMLRGLLFSQVAEGRKPEATVDQLLERVAAEGRVDVHGYYLHRAVIDSVRDITLDQELQGWRGPTLLAQIQTRPRLSPANAVLAAALAERGAPVATAFIAEEPGWHFTQNPAWECPELERRTMEWLDALA